MWQTWVFVLGYTLSPLSTTALFTAAGMSKVPDHEGSDSELAIVVSAACVGMALTAATTLMAVPQSNVAVGFGYFDTPRLVIATSRQIRISGSCGSPPTNLRL